MRIACLQFAPQVGDVDNNLNRADAVLSRANPKNLDLLVLPELAFSGYNFDSKEDIGPYLEPTTSGITSLWARTTALKYECAVTVGYPETAKGVASPTYYSSTITVNADGETVANYRKAFLYCRDEAWASEGPDGFYSGEMPGLGNVAMGICMDLNPYKFEVPWTAWEFAYHVLHRQANLVVISMAWLSQQDLASHSMKSKEPDMDILSYWVSRLEPVIRAEDVGEVVVVLANRCGFEGKAIYAGTSCVLGINAGEVKVYGILGRDEKDLLVVDTAAPPEFKLVAAPYSINPRITTQSRHTSAELEHPKQVQPSHKPPRRVTRVETPYPSDTRAQGAEALIASIDPTLSRLTPSRRARVGTPFPSDTRLQGREALIASIDAMFSSKSAPTKNKSESSLPLDGKEQGHQALVTSIDSALPRPLAPEKSRDQSSLPPVPSGPRSQLRGPLGASIESAMLLPSRRKRSRVETPHPSDTGLQGREALVASIDAALSGSTPRKSTKVGFRFPLEIRAKVRAALLTSIDAVLSEIFMSSPIPGTATRTFFCTSPSGVEERVERTVSHTPSDSSQTSSTPVSSLPRSHVPNLKTPVPPRRTQTPRTYTGILPSGEGSQSKEQEQVSEKNLGRSTDLSRSLTTHTLESRIPQFPSVEISAEECANLPPDSASTVMRMNMPWVDEWNIDHHDRVPDSASSMRVNTPWESNPIVHKAEEIIRIMKGSTLSPRMVQASHSAALSLSMKPATCASGVTREIMGSNMIRNWFPAMRTMSSVKAVPLPTVPVLTRRISEPIMSSSKSASPPRASLLTALKARPKTIEGRGFIQLGTMVKELTLPTQSAITEASAAPVIGLAESIGPVTSCQPTGGSSPESLSKSRFDPDNGRMVAA